MKSLPPGRFETVRRCLADIDGKRYFGEVFNGRQRIFVDPEHPALQRPPMQWAYTSGSNTGASGTVMFVQFT